MTDAIPRWWDGAVLATANVACLILHPALAEQWWWHRRTLPAFATPRGHSALLQWRKIFDHDPRFVVLANKLTAKQWARARVPEIEVAEVVWTGTRAEDVPDALLEPGYVLKTNHGTGHNHFPHRKRWRRDRLNRRVRKWMRPYRRWGEWANMQVEPILFVERQVGDGEPLWEVTFRCHDGKVTTSFVAIDLKTAHEVDAFFDSEDRRLPPIAGMPDAEQFPRDFVPPPTFQRAKAYATRLSKGIDYARIDLVFFGDRVFFQEMTLYPQSGHGVEERAHIALPVERAWLGTIEGCWFLSTPQPWPLSLYAAAFRRWLAGRRIELGVNPAPAPGSPAPAR